jgi:hypothetical protein
MESKPYRIKLKIGDNEFDAEGDPEIVKEAFANFMKAVAAMPPPKANPPESELPPPPPPPPGLGGVPANPAEFSRVFRQGDPLSLAALPRGENAKPDALLILLYGYTQLGGEQAVTGTMLMKAARQSGVAIDRVDRTLDLRKEFVLAAGTKKGRRYSLNNRGIIEAQRLMKELFE